jgi:tRNA dimethylallyltransferase
MTKQKAIAIMGPTASGKTDLALSLAEQLDGEIISVDSALVYRGLNIGAAKPSPEELARIPHHLIDIRDPSEPYSAADFAKDAKVAIEGILERGRLPILAGGTMLYFKALLEGLSDLPEADLKIRDQIEELANEWGWPAVHKKLAEVDSLSAERIHPNHSQRLSRAYEVFLISGKPMSEWQQGGSGGVLDLYHWCQICVSPRDRGLLHERIELRFKRMLELGFIKEVEALRARGNLNRDLPAVRAVGYRQVWDFLDGAYDRDALIDKGVAATRQLAKRQLTWLRGWPDLHWLDIQQDDGNVRKLQEITNIALSFFNESAI